MLAFTYIYVHLFFSVMLSVYSVCSLVNTGVYKCKVVFLICVSALGSSEVDVFITVPRSLLSYQY